MTVPSNYKRTWGDYAVVIIVAPLAWLVLGFLIELITIAHERM